MFVTPLYAGILVLWFVVLSLRVIDIRRRGVSFGDAGDRAITRVVRAQANFAEYVPVALLMMGFLEVDRYSIYWLHALGIVLVVARLLHAWGVSRHSGNSAGRTLGAGLTVIGMVAMALLLLWQFFTVAVVLAR
jgi:uncharacterized membrane protein YecN with MAPEG domain